MKEDLSGEYFPLVGMKEKVRQQLVDKHFIFVSGDKNLIAAGMERDCPASSRRQNNAAKIAANKMAELALLICQL